LDLGGLNVVTFEDVFFCMSSESKFGITDFTTWAARRIIDVVHSSIRASKGINPGHVASESGTVSIELSIPQGGIMDGTDGLGALTFLLQTNN
jgi:hypothetical protein